MKELPYFKFTPTEWLTGDIVYESFEVQGLFISICVVYWQRGGNLSLEDIEKRYKKPTALDSLIGRFISVTDGFISVKFLDEQFKERGYISTVNSQNGSKGGRPKGAKTLVTKATANRPQSEPKAKKSNIEQEEDKEKEQKIEFEVFYNLYQKKVDGKDAKLKWDKLSLETQELILAHVPKYVLSTPDKQFRKSPLVYLNKESWNDEVKNIPKETKYIAQHNIVTN
jgi:hypothetical protein